MSTVTQKDVKSPFGQRVINRVIGRMYRLRAYQGAPATATVDVGLVQQASVIGDLYLLAHKTAAAGESLVIDVLVNGVSVLTARFTYDATQPKGKQVSLKSLLAGAPVHMAPGDLVQVAFAYTPGGSPALYGVEVTLEPTPE